MSHTYHGGTPTVGSTTTYRDNYDRVFGKPKPK